MLTVKEMTNEYNVYATYLELPTIKKLEKTKKGTPTERLYEMKCKYEIQFEKDNEGPMEESQPAKKINQRKIPVTVDGTECETLSKALRLVGLNTTTDWLKVRALLKKTQLTTYKDHTFEQV